MTPAEFTAARTALGLSTAEMAKIMRVTQRAIQNYESGSRPIPGPATAIIEIMLKSPKAAQYLKSVL